MQGTSIHWTDRDQDQTNYQGRSAQVRNLHVVNLRLWCNFSEVSGELLMGPGQVVRSYLSTHPMVAYIRWAASIDPSLRRLLGPHPTEADSTVVPLLIKSVSAWRAPSGPGTWTEGKDQVKEGWKDASEHKQASPD